MATIAKYNKTALVQAGGTSGTATRIDFDTDVIKVMLVASTYVPAPITHITKADITGEVTGTGYTAGGATLGSVTLNEVSGTTTFDAADAVWLQNAAGFSNARYGILYKDTGTANTSTLIGYIDFVSNQGNVTGDLTIVFNAAGIATFN